MFCLTCAGIDRIAVERVGQALDLETLFRCGLRRERRAGNGHHRLHLASPVLVTRSGSFQIAGADGAVERTLHRLAADVERHVAGVLGHGARRQQQPGILLGGSRAQERAGGLDPLLGGLHGRRAGAAFRGERDDGCGVAQCRAVVLAAREVGLRLRPERSERRRIDALGARAVADQRQRGGDLRLGDRRRQRVELGVGEIAQVADRRQAVARQHIERVGEIGAAVLARIG